MLCPGQRHTTVPHNHLYINKSSFMPAYFVEHELAHRVEVAQEAQSTGMK